MGRTTGWLAEQRPAMVELLTEIERNSSYTRGNAVRGDLSLLLKRLSRIAAGKGRRPRSLQAMRQAWWRWTSEGAHATTPPVQDLALMIRHAKKHGWLQQLESRTCWVLVERLMTELEEAGASAKPELEDPWIEPVANAVEVLVGFLEEQIVTLADGEPELVVSPPGFVVQDEVGRGLIEFVEQLMVRLEKPRGLFVDPHRTDAYIRPHEGWPAELRRLASNVADILNSAAERCEEYETSFYSGPTGSDSSVKRTRIFDVPLNGPNEKYWDDSNPTTDQPLSPSGPSDEEPEY